MTTAMVVCASRVELRASHLKYRLADGRHRADAQPAQYHSGFHYLARFPALNHYQLRSGEAQPRAQRLESRYPAPRCAQCNAPVQRVATRFLAPKHPLPHSCTALRLCQAGGGVNRLIDDASTPASPPPPPPAPPALSPRYAPHSSRPRHTSPRGWPGR